MSELRRRLAHRDLRVAVATGDDLTVDLLRFAVSGLTLAVAVFLTLVH